MKHFTNKLMLILILLGIGTVQAQQLGSVHGTVLDESNNNEPIYGVVAKIKGTSIGATTDFDGKFKINASPGTYALVLSFMGYKTKIVEGVTINSGQISSFKITMQEDLAEVDGVTIEARVDRTSEEALLVERKKSNNLTQIMGAEALEKAAAGTVAEGVKKVVGLSVVGSKYVYVRGLGDRYNSTYLNGFPVASPDPDRRVLPLNLFPTAIVKNITVVKNFATNLYGDFSGGALLIETKDFPEYKTLKVGVGISGNSQTTFKDFMSTYEKENDALGFNKDRENFGTDDYKLYTTRFDPNMITAPINKSFSIVFGNQYTLNADKGTRLGLVLSTNFSDGYEYQMGNFKRLRADGSSLIDFDFDNYNYKTNKSLLAGVNLELNPRNTFAFSTFYTHTSSDATRDAYGPHFDYTDDIYQRRFTYRDNSLLAPQLNVKHQLHDRLSLHWGASYSMAKSNEPDRRQMLYFYTRGNEDGDKRFNSIDVFNNHRFFYEMQDDDLAAKTFVSYVIKANDEDADNPFSKVDVGVDYRKKNRDFNSNKYQYNVNNIKGNFDIDKVDDFLDVKNQTAPGDKTPNTYSVNDGTQLSDKYDADLKIIGTYASLSHVFSKRFFAKIGYRVETSIQGVDYRAQTDSPILPIRREQKTDVNILPSLVGKYSFTEENLLKFSASRTIARPDFKEVSEFSYKAFFGGYSSLGNPLLDNGYNYNADIRFEKYLPNGVGFFAIGGYAKYLEGAITPVIASGATEVMTFVNAESANVAGVELEFSRKLDFIQAPFFQNLTFNTNVSFNFSEVNVGEIDSDKHRLPIQISSDTRPMIGASPYLLNLDLNYTRESDKWETSWTLAYNIFGRRLTNIGAQGLGDIYQLPAGSLNLSIRNNFGLNKRWGVNLVAKNLLNPEYKTEQEILENDTKVDFSSYNKGISYSLGISYDVFVD